MPTAAPRIHAPRRPHECVYPAIGEPKWYRYGQAPRYHPPTVAYECQVKQTTYVTSFEITVPLDASCVCRHTSPLQKLRLAPRYLPLPPIHKSPIAVVVVVTLPVAKPIPPTVTRFEAETRYHGGFVIGVTERYLSPSPAPHSGVRVAGLGGAAVTG